MSGSASKSDSHAASPIIPLQNCTRFFVRIHTPKPNVLDFNGLWKALIDIKEPRSFSYKNIQLIMLGENRRADFIQYAYNNKRDAPSDAVLLEIILPKGCDIGEQSDTLAFLKEKVNYFIMPSQQSSRTPNLVVITTINTVDSFSTPMSADIPTSSCLPLADRDS